MSRFLDKINKIICEYLGLVGNEVDRLRFIKRTHNKIFIYRNAPFLRHKSVESWDHFNESGIYHENEINKQKIGMAAGKTIAKNLVISFNKIDIKENE